MKKLIAILFIIWLQLSSLFAQTNNYVDDAKNLIAIKRILDNGEIKNLNVDNTDAISKELYKIYNGQSIKSSSDNPGSHIHPQVDTSAGSTDLIPSQDFKDEVKKYLLLISNSSCKDINDRLTSLNTSYHFKYAAVIVTNSNNGGDRGSATSGSPIPGFTFPEEQIIYGITDFIITRAKEQLLESFLTRFHDTLEANKVVKALFPASLGVIQSFIDDQSLALAKYGDLFKAAFEEDLRNIPVTFQNEDTVKMILVQLGYIGSDSDELASAISGSTIMAYSLYQKKQLPDIISLMSSRARSKSILTKFNKTVILTDVLSDGLISWYVSNDNKRICKIITPDMISSLSRDELAMFVKLIVCNNYEKLEKIKAGLADTIIPKSSGFINSLTELSNTYTNIKQLFDAKTKLDIEDVATLMANHADVIKRTNELLHTLINEQVPEKFIQCIDYISEIHTGLSTANYGKIMDGTINIFKIFSSDKEQKITVKYLVKYGSFAVNIMSSKDEKQVTAALNELIPHDLYKIKSEIGTTISLSAYPGVTFGRENLLNDRLLQVYNTESSLSLYLPIGIDLNFAGSKRKCSWGFLFQVVDLGAVLNYRLNPDSTESSEPQIGFSQLLSPGLALLIRPGKSSFTFGLNANYTPKLRKIENNMAITKANTLRYGVFAAIDVTALPIHFSKK